MLLPREAHVLLLKAILIRALVTARNLSFILGAQVKTTHGLLFLQVPLTPKPCFIVFALRNCLKNTWIVKQEVKHVSLDLYYAAQSTAHKKYTCVGKNTHAWAAETVVQTRPALHFTCEQNKIRDYFERHSQCLRD